VLEAFAAGAPVIGSNLGGIAELIENEVNGILVETDSVEMWRQAMRRCSEDRTLIERLRRGIRSPREMDAVAGEMLRIYSALLEADQCHNGSGQM
jgi:glycosyltransferase involved in cell wall biosynthesis